MVLRKAYTIGNKPGNHVHTVAVPPEYTGNYRLPLVGLECFPHWPGDKVDTGSRRLRQSLIQGQLHLGIEDFSFHDNFFTRILMFTYVFGDFMKMTGLQAIHFEGLFKKQISRA